MTNFSKKLFRSLDHSLDKADRLKNDLHFVIREGIDFSRKAKKLSFKDTILLILSMAAKPIREELLDYFDYSTFTPSASAFVQARSKISPDAFRFLFDELNNLFPATDTYKGFRLIAVDGSELQIPVDFNDVDTLHSCCSKDKFLSSYHVNACYDLLNNRYVDMILQGSHSKNEVLAMWTMAERFHDDKAIFIADRNYPTWNNMAHIISSAHFFLIRSKDILSSSSILRKFNLPDDEFDIDLSITLTTKQTNDVKEHPEKYRFLSTSSTFDFFEKDHPFYTIHFRVVRFKLEDSHTYESIVTNLDREEFSIEEIKELYHMRWGLEVSFRHLKYSSDLCALHARKRQSIQQEIWARMILCNMSFILMHHMIKEKVDKVEKQRKYIYSFNKKRVIHLCRNYFHQRKRKGGDPPDLEAHILNEVLPIRPNRKYARNLRAQRVVCFNYRFS